MLSDFHVIQLQNIQLYKMEFIKLNGCLTKFDRAYIFS